MKPIFIFFLLIIISLANKYDNFGEPDVMPKEISKSFKRMSLPGYNPTAIINKVPSSIEHKADNILPYGEWNEQIAKENKKIKYFTDKNLEKIRTSTLDMNEEKAFRQVYNEEYQKINWLKSLPKNNVFIRAHNPDISSNQTGIFKGMVGTSHNYPQSNYFYSSFPEYQPVHLPKIEKEPVIFLIIN